jgi:hypothetical protein
MRDKTIIDSAAFLKHFRSPNEYLLAPTASTENKTSQNSLSTLGANPDLAPTTTKRDSTLQRRPTLQNKPSHPNQEPARLISRSSTGTGPDEFRQFTLRKRSLAGDVMIPSILKCLPMIPAYTSPTARPGRRTLSRSPSSDKPEPAWPYPLRLSTSTLASQLSRCSSTCFSDHSCPQ